MKELFKKFGNFLFSGRFASQQGGTEHIEFSNDEVEPVEGQIDFSDEEAAKVEGQQKTRAKLAEDQAEIEAQYARKAKRKVERAHAKVGEVTEEKPKTLHELFREHEQEIKEAKRTDPAKANVLQRALDANPRYAKYKAERAERAERAESVGILGALREAQAAEAARPSEGPLAEKKDDTEVAKK